MLIFLNLSEKHGSLGWIFKCTYAFIILSQHRSWVIKKKKARIKDNFSLFWLEFCFESCGKNIFLGVGGVGERSVYSKLSFCGLIKM